MLFEEFEQHLFCSEPNQIDDPEYNFQVKLIIKKDYANLDL